MSIVDSGTIYIVDDIQENRQLLQTIINKMTDYNVISFSDGNSMLSAISNDNPDLILLDIMMPDLDGFQVSKILKNDATTEGIPIIFITALSDIDSKSKAFEVGGVDYISKPFNPKEVVSRVRTHIKLRKLINNLENEVNKRTLELAQINRAFVLALERANYYNDEDTGNHIKRVSEYSKLIAEELGMPDDFINLIFRFASLHDIGKVGIPPEILKKPGKLTPEEYMIMMTHSYLGFKMIDHESISDVAKNLVYTHHEKYDGTGYPRKLKGEDIPIEGRIVAVADVYDALRVRRIYKEPFSEEESYDIMIKGSGNHFDPRIIDIVIKKRKELNDIFNELNDT